MPNPTPKGDRARTTVRLPLELKRRIIRYQADHYPLDQNDIIVAAVREFLDAHEERAASSMAQRLFDSQNAGGE